MNKARPIVVVAADPCFRTRANIEQKALRDKASLSTTTPERLTYTGDMRGVLNAVAPGFRKYRLSVEAGGSGFTIATAASELFNKSNKVRMITVLGDDAKGHELAAEMRAVRKVEHSIGFSANISTPHSIVLAHAARGMEVGTTLWSPVPERSHLGPKYERRFAASDPHFIPRDERGVFVLAGANQSFLIREHAIDILTNARAKGSATMVFVTDDPQVRYFDKRDFGRLADCADVLVMTPEQAAEMTHGEAQKKEFAFGETIGLEWYRDRGFKSVFVTDFADLRGVTYYCSSPNVFRMEDRVGCMKDAFAEMPWLEPFRQSRPGLSNVYAKEWFGAGLATALAESHIFGLRRSVAYGMAAACYGAETGFPKGDMDHAAVSEVNKYYAYFKRALNIDLPQPTRGPDEIRRPY